MKRSIISYLLLIGIYSCFYNFVNFTTIIMLSFEITVVIGFGCMIIFFLLIKKRHNNFESPYIYICNLAFIGILALTTIIYDQTVGLTTVEYTANGMMTVFSNSKFYEYTLAFNQAVILSTLLLIVHTIVKQLWKNLLICLGGLALFIGYFLLVV